MIRVVVADDHPVIRVGFCALLDSQPDMSVVGEAADGAEAVALAEQTRPDVLIMDVRMPNLDGIEATRRIRRLEPPPRVLVVTTFGIDDYVIEALAAGAQGFLLKDAPADRIVQAVKDLAGGHYQLDAAVISKLVREVAARRTVEPPAFHLTAREREVLQRMADGLTNREISARMSVELQTVKTHVGHVLQKLGARDRRHAVEIAGTHGLVPPPAGAREP